MSVWKPLRPETGREAVFIRSGNPFARTYETFLIPGPVSGSCRGAPELGIDEPEGAENFRESMSRAIEQCIERYEPRISHAEVQAVVSSASSPLDMTFHITAWVTFNETHEVLEFDMAPNGSQHYRVD